MTTLLAGGNERRRRANQPGRGSITRVGVVITAVGLGLASFGRAADEQFSGREARPQLARTRERFADLWTREAVADVHLASRRAAGPAFPPAVHSAEESLIFSLPKELRRDIKAAQQAASQS